jgi:hypothetical protein
VRGGNSLVTRYFKVNGNGKVLTNEGSFEKENEESLTYILGKRKRR